MRKLKSVGERLTSFAVLDMIIREHGRRVAGILQGDFGAMLGGVDAAENGFWTLQVFLQTLLTAARDRMEAAEQSHGAQDEASRHSPHRAERQRAAKQVGADMLNLRKIFEGLYEPEELESLGFPRRVARGCEAILSQGEELVQTLGDPGLELPASRFGEHGFSPATMAQKITPGVTTLRWLTDAIDREEEATATLRRARDRAIAKYDETFEFVARTLEALYLLAGETELAERVRPSKRRHGRTEWVAEGKEKGSGSEAE